LLGTDGFRSYKIIYIDLCLHVFTDEPLYFMQLLMNLPSWPANDLDAWLPGRWKQAHAAARCEALEIRNTPAQFLKTVLHVSLTLFRDCVQILMDGHEVVGFAARIRKALRQEFVK